MAFQAIDPETGESHDVEWFHKNRKKIGLCIVCRDEMELRAEASIETTVHFWHGRGSTCPTVKKNRKKYEDLPASEIDIEVGSALRREVRENGHIIFMTCSAIVGGLSYSQFKELIIKASEKSIWDYKGLTLNYIPYLLVTFHDMFYARGSKIRNEPFYVILEPGIHHLDDLWNKPNFVKQKIWKVSPNKGVVEEVDIKNHLDPEPDWFKSAKQTWEL